jgi:hypothetical protein
MGRCGYYRSSHHIICSRLGTIISFIGNEYMSQNPRQKPKQKKKKRKKIGVVQVIKWLFIALVCFILILGIISRIQHYITHHIK